MYIYCTSTIPRRLNCIGKNQKQVQHFKPLKHNQKQKAEIKITNLLPRNKANYRSVIKILIKTEVLQSKVGRTALKFWLIIPLRGSEMYVHNCN